MVSQENKYFYNYLGFTISRAKVRDKTKFSVWKGNKLIDIYNSHKKARDQVEALAQNDI